MASEFYTADTDLTTEPPALPRPPSVLQPARRTRPSAAPTFARPSCRQRSKEPYLTLIRRLTKRKLMQFPPPHTRYTATSRLWDIYICILKRRTPISKGAPRRQTLREGQSAPRRPAPRGSGPQKPAPRREGARMAASEIVLRAERPPALPHGPLRSQPGAVPALPPPRTSAPQRLSPPGLSLHPTKNYKPQGLKTKKPGFQEWSPFLICFVLKKGRGGSEATWWAAPAAGVWTARPRHPSESCGSGFKQPVQARQCSLLNKESTSAHSSKQGHSRFAHAQKARREMSHPTADTARLRKEKTRHRGHAHLAHAYTIAHTDSQSDFRIGLRILQA